MMPTWPSDWGETDGGARETTETLLLPALVTSARSRYGSTATPAGEVPTVMGWITVRLAAFDTVLSTFFTCNTKRRAETRSLAGIVAVIRRALTTVTFPEGRAAPSSRTLEPVAKPIPLMVTESVLEDV